MATDMKSEKLAGKILGMMQDELDKMSNNKKFIIANTAITAVIISLADIFYKDNCLNEKLAYVNKITKLAIEFINKNDKQHENK